MEPPVIHLRQHHEENLFDQDHLCKRYSILYKAFAQRAADRWNGTPEMAYINKKIAKYMPESSPTVNIDSHPRLSGIMDTVNSTRAHGPSTKLPAEFYDAKLLANMNDMVVDEWFAGYQESQEFRKLGKGQMAGDVVGRMMAAALGRDKEPLRFAMTGSHDTTLAGFLSSFGAFEGVPWPPFTSHMAIELFRKKNPDPSNRPLPPLSPVDTQAPAAPRTTWFSSLTSIFSSSNASSSPSGSETGPTIRKPLADFSASERAHIQDYYVRIRYNDKPVTIPGCRAPGRHLEGVEGGESFCTLEAFKRIADAFTPRDWTAECKARLDEGFTVGPAEPAGYPEGEGSQN